VHKAVIIQTIRQKWWRCWRLW